jgi:oligopeptide transport system substrate-binding protein
MDGSLDASSGIEKAVWEGRTCTRRQFLGTAAAAAGLLALAGCGGSASSSPSPAKSGGTLVFGMLTTVGGFDPQKWWNGAAYNGVANAFEGLIGIDPYTQEILPVLAQSLPEMSNGGTRYTFKLRSGIKFQNGQPLTADDVKFSFERLVSPSLAAETGSLFTVLPIKGMAALLSGKSKTLSGITTPDSQTVVFDFDTPDSAFVDVITYPSTGIVPKALVEEIGQKKFNWAPIGTGPYRIKVIDQSQQIVLERNRAYWKAGVPSIDRVEWNLGVSPELSVLRIEDGKQDLMFEQIPSGSLSTLRTQYQKQVILTKQNNCYWLSLNIKQPDLAKLQVRQAIAQAINKDHLVQVMRGLGTAASGGIFSPESAYYQDGLAYAYDPEKAKALLQKAGYTNGFSVNFWGINQFPYLDLGQAIQQDLAAVGIRVTFKPMTYDAFVGFVGGQPAGMVEFAWELPYPHGSYIMDAAFTSSSVKGGGPAYASWSSPSFDKLTIDAHRATDPAEVVSLYKQMDKIVTRDEALWVPLVYPVRADFISSRLRDYQGSVSLGEDRWEVFYRYKLA